MAEAATENDNQQEDVSRETEEQGEGLLLDSVKLDDQDQTAEQEPMSHREEDDVDPETVEFERPEWFPPKFWSDEEGPNVQNVCKSLTNLERKFSMGEHKAPKDGDYKIDDIIEGKVEKDDPVLGSLLEVAKTYDAPVAMVHDLIKNVLETTDVELERVQSSNEEQMKILGPKADELLKNTGRMGANLHTKGVLSDEEYEEFKFMGNTALGVRVFNKVFNYYGEKNIPVVDANADLGISDDELRARVGDPRYKTDPSFRAETEKLFEKRYPGEYKPG